MRVVRRHFVDLLQVPNDVEAVGEGSSAVGAAESSRLRALVAHVAGEWMLDLVPRQDLGQFGLKLATL